MKENVNGTKGIPAHMYQKFKTKLSNSARYLIRARSCTNDLS